MGRLRKAYGRTGGRPCGQFLAQISCKVRAPSFVVTGAAAHYSWKGPYVRHVLSALVQNVPGVLAQIAGMFASRGYNIDSLAVGETEDPHLSRMTFVVVGDDRMLEQVRKQLEKVVTVVRVDDISSKEHVERDLMLVKVKGEPGGKRSEIRELVSIFRGRIVDVGPDEVMIEISGRETKIEAFIERMRPYGIIELVRTGRIAMVRSEALRPAKLSQANTIAAKGEAKVR